MGLETGTKLSDLVVTNPVAGDPKSQGDDHLRLIKVVLATTQKKILFDVTTVTGTSGNATAGYVHVCTNGSAVTMTLPASPEAGDVCGFCFTNGGATNVLARNGQPIQTTASDETLSGYAAGTTTIWRYVDATRGWIKEA